MNNQTFVNINELQTFSEISSNKLDSIHNMLWENAVDRFFNKHTEDIFGDKSYYRCSEYIQDYTMYYEPTYLYAISRNPAKTANNIEYQTYSFSYTYMFNSNESFPTTYNLEVLNEKSHNIFVDLNKNKQIEEIKLNSIEFSDENYIGKYDNRVSKEKTLYAIKFDKELDLGTFTYSYTYLLSMKIDNTFYSFDKFIIYLEDFWNQEYFLKNLISEEELDEKYNLAGDEDNPTIFEDDYVDYIKGVVTFKDKLSNKTTKIKFSDLI